MQGRHMIQPVNIRHSVPVQGIPTTRAGSIVTSDTMIVRDPLYTGDPIEERASVVLRIAPSFFRFGSFEIFNHTDIKTGRHTHSGTPAHGPGSPPAVTPTALSSFVVQRSQDNLAGRSARPELHAIYNACSACNSACQRTYTMVTIGLHARRAERALGRQGPRAHHAPGDAGPHHTHLLPPHLEGSRGHTQRGPHALLALCARLSDTFTMRVTSQCVAVLPRGWPLLQSVRGQTSPDCCITLSRLAGRRAGYSEAQSKME